MTRGLFLNAFCKEVAEIRASDKGLSLFEGWLETVSDSMILAVCRAVPEKHSFDVIESYAIGR